MITAKHRPYIIVAAIIIIMTFCLMIRLAPLARIEGAGGALNLSAPDDPLYNFRQVDQIIQNYPFYAWYDPMTLYPIGQTIYWGPLFPLIAATLCIIFGMTTLPDIIFFCQFIPPVMAALMVPVMFYIGKRMVDWKTGLISAFFIAAVSGQFFQRSLYGYFDHHIAEVLFSTLFCLGYITILAYTKEHQVDFGVRPWQFRDIKSLKIPIILSVITAAAYLAALFVMPTAILFALIVSAFTIVQYAWDFFRQRSSDYLFLANTIIFGCSTIGLLLFGIKHPDHGLDLSKYTMGHVYAYITIILGTWFLSFHARYMKGRKWYYYLGSLAGVGLVISTILFFFPAAYNMLIGGLISFFGQMATTLTVQEARGWSSDVAWMTFNFGFVLMAIGMAAIIYRNRNEEHPDQIFVMVWSLIMLFSTWQHIRYEYYLAVNIALLSAFAVGVAIDRDWKTIRNEIFSPPKEERAESRKEKRRKEKKKVSKPSRGVSGGTTTSLMLVGTVLILSGFFVITSLQTNMLYSTGTIANSDWIESMNWMRSSTPDPGIEYYTIYGKEGYTYPAGSYGVMSWWDYGHQITLTAKRAPNANPFQAGVTPPYGASAFFITQSEENANEIADYKGTRYVVTDIEMDTGKFWAMATWFNSSASDTPYNPRYIVSSQTQPGQYEMVTLYNQSYFETMVSRLHNFDGSMAPANKAFYIEYQMPGATGLSFPLVTNARMIENAADYAEQYNQNPQFQTRANAASQSILMPVKEVSALRHYRLVHESPSSVLDDYDLKYVKIFEYVKGAHIKGEGIIHAEILTNTGRHFVYSQRSINGEFIVPYPTEGSPYGTQAVSPYQIEGTGQIFNVTEEAVIQGLTI